MLEKVAGYLRFGFLLFHGRLGNTSHFDSAHDV